MKVHLSGGPPKSRVGADVLHALGRAIVAADPGKMVSETLGLNGRTLEIGALKFDLPQYRRVLVLGGGKASGRMALELERVLGRHITAGVVNVPEYQKLRKASRIIFNPSTHPTPSAKGADGVRKMLRLVGEPSGDDLVICLLSGGASSLMPSPLPAVSIREKADITDLLLRSGADIHEINTVRKHLSSTKGGRLAELLQPATVVSLIISDVVGDRIDSVSSGVTAPDPTTYSDAKRVLVERRVWNKASTSVRETIEKGIDGSIAETPKPGSRVFRKVHNILIGSNRISRLAAGRELRARGYSCTVLSREVTGEARDLGERMVKMVKVRASSKKPWAMVGGGETVVTVKGEGTGGRNQELALSVALGIKGMDGIAFGSVATDGIDGPTDAAGAIADGSTVTRAMSMGLSAQRFLELNDSHEFFRKLGDLIVTGPTGTNVNDIFVAVGRPVH